MCLIRIKHLACSFLSCLECSDTLCTATHPLFMMGLANGNVPIVMIWFGSLFKCAANLTYVRTTAYLYDFRHSDNGSLELNQINIS